MSEQPVEQLYLDAARAYFRAVESTPPLEDDVIERSAAFTAKNDDCLRAAVDVAYAAGRRAPITEGDPK